MKTIFTTEAQRAQRGNFLCVLCVSVVNPAPGGPTFFQLNLKR
jgi:hypothetical protein